MPPKTRAASLREGGPAVLSDEIRRAFSSNAVPKEHPETDRALTQQDTGAPPGGAIVTVPILPSSATNEAEGFADRARRIDEVSGGKPCEVTVPSCEDLRAELVRLEADHGLTVDRLASRLSLLQDGQRDIRLRAVELDSAIGSMTSDINALGRRVATLELSPERPSRSGSLPTLQQNLREVLQDGAADAAPAHTQSINVRSPNGARNDAPNSPIHSQLPFHTHAPLEPQAAGSQAAAPNHGAAPLITTATSSAPLPRGAVLRSPSAETGPYAPGLEPVQTMLPPFARVEEADRRTVPYAGDVQWREADQAALFPEHAERGLRGLRNTEAFAVRALAYFLAPEAKDVYQAQVSPGALTGHEALEATWPYVIHALIRRFLSDDVLQSAYDAVVRAVRGSTEDEVKFAQRISDAARECCHVFQPMELVNSYVRGLHEATRERVQEQVRRLPQKERTSLVTVRQIAAAEGRAQRALLRPRTPQTKFMLSTPGASQTHKVPRNSAILIDPNTDPHDPVMLASPPTTPTTVPLYCEPAPDDYGASQYGYTPDPEADTQPPGDPVSIVDAVVMLESIFMVNEATKETLDGYNLDGAIFCALRRRSLT